MKRRIGCLYLPNWPIQRLGGREIQNSEFRIQNFRKRPTKENHSAFCILHSAFPILLHSRDARRGDLVVACNAAAGNCGVRLGMPLAEAAALAGHGHWSERGGHSPPSSKNGGPALVDHRYAAAPSSLSHPTLDRRDAYPTILPHERAADLAELARLAERCERFSPIVGWETAEGLKSKVQSPKSSTYLGPRTLNFGLLGPDCLFLDVTGIGVLFGGEERLAEAVVADFDEQGYEARVAVAETIGAAWAVATQEGSRF